MPGIPPKVTQTLFRVMKSSIKDYVRKLNRIADDVARDMGVSEARISTMTEAEKAGYLPLGDFGKSAASIKREAATETGKQLADPGLTSKQRQEIFEAHNSFKEGLGQITKEFVPFRKFAVEKLRESKAFKKEKQAEKLEEVQKGILGVKDEMRSLGALDDLAEERAVRGEIRLQRPFDKGEGPADIIPLFP